MRFVVAVLALVAFASSASAWEKKVNFKGTDWAAMDCNGAHTILQCTLNGGEGDGGPDKGAEGKGK